jgi:hypothetical protein
MKQTARILRVFALLLGLGVTAAFAATAHADGEPPPPPVVDTWPGKVVCGGDEALGDEVCYTVPDVSCRIVDGVVEDCAVRDPEKKPGDTPPGPEAPAP